MPSKSKIKYLPPKVKVWLDQVLVENDFSGYELLAKELKQRGYEISKSALHRYGQGFEQRLAAIKIATEQAKAVTAAAKDEGNDLNDALIRLVQTKAFEVLVDLENAGDVDLSKLGRMVADIARASVSQKKWAEDMRGKLEAKLTALDGEAKSGKLDSNTLAIVREQIYGIV